MATTKPAETKPEPILSPKAQGVALFIQFTRSGATQQIILVSETDANGIYRPPQLLTRQVSEKAKRRPWDVRVAQDPKEKDPAKRVASYFDFFSKWFATSFGNPDWVQKGDPIAVEVTAADYEQLSQTPAKAPDGMINRIASIVKEQEDGE